MKQLMVVLFVLSLAASEEMVRLEAVSTSQDSGGISSILQPRVYTREIEEPPVPPTPHRKEKVRHNHRFRDRLHGKKKLHRVHVLDYRRGFIPEAQPLRDESTNMYEKPQHDAPFSQAYFWSYTGNGGLSDLWQQAIRVQPDKDKKRKAKPRAMPVTENLKRDMDPVAYYGLPKELRPIHPGGGSKFEDLEKERLERAKMAHTKENGAGGENGAGHDAEGLYSSASLTSLSVLVLSLVVCTRLLT